MDRRRQGLPEIREKRKIGRVKCTKKRNLRRDDTLSHSKLTWLLCWHANVSVAPFLRAGQLAAGASRVLLESDAASLPLCPAPSSPGSSFAFSSLSFPGVGLVSGPDPVQYLSPSSVICSHFHMFNIHISCLLPCPIAVTGSCSLRLGLRATGHPGFCCFPLIPPGEYWRAATYSSVARARSSLPPPRRPPQGPHA